jgi:hypothetical protein
MPPLLYALLSLALNLALSGALSPQRPSALVGSWQAAGLTLTLKSTGVALIYELSPPSSPKLLERSRWWVEGERLCLTAGLSRVCEPYTLNANGLSLAAKGVTFKRQPL